jgi:hypothetical protein
MASMSKQQAEEVGRALAQESVPVLKKLQPVTGRGGVAGGVFRGKSKEGVASSGSGGLASQYVETGRTWGDTATALVTKFTSDGLFAIGMVPIKTLTLAEADSAGNPVTGTAVTITLSGAIPP